MTRPHDGTPGRVALALEATRLIEAADAYDDMADEGDGEFRAFCRRQAGRLKRAAWELGEEADRGKDV